MANSNVKRDPQVILQRATHKKLKELSFKTDIPLYKLVAKMLEHCLKDKELLENLVLESKDKR